MTPTSSPKLTDDAVSSLPLDAARAELLEEIMDTVAPDRPVPDLVSTTRGTRRRRWLVPVAAAAAVATLALSTVWWAGGFGQKTTDGLATAFAAGPDGDQVLLSAPGWRLTSASSGEGLGDITYTSGSRSLEVTSYPADSYASYVEDREHIVDPPAPGQPLQILGLPAQMWAYGARDHTAIREVDGGHWMEFRGEGMDEAGFTTVLGQLGLVSHADFEAALPHRFVSDDERAVVTQRMLDGVTTASGTGWPAAAPSLTSSESDPYQLGAFVAGRYACAWLGEYVADTASGDTSGAVEAVRVMGTSRQWPVLQQMNAEGDYPEAVWQYADELAAGQQPDGFREGLGC